MKLTLVDSKVAKVGYEFVTYGDAEECRDCKLIKTCIENLESERRYRIVNTRDMEHDCKIMGRAIVVEVEECDVASAIDQKKVFTGSKVEFVPVSCDNILCKNMKYCKPDGLKSGDACKILDAAGKIDCESGKDLVLVKLRRL
jgi:uncharacterized protein (UPF0179 family)